MENPPVAGKNFLLVTQPPVSLESIASRKDMEFRNFKEDTITVSLAELPENHPYRESKEFHKGKTFKILGLLTRLELTIRTSACVPLEMLQLQIYSTTGIDLDQQILFRQEPAATPPPGSPAPSTPAPGPSTPSPVPPSTPSPAPTSEEPLDPSRTLFDLGIKAHDTIVLRVSLEAFHRSLKGSSGKEEEGFLGTKLISHVKNSTKENQTPEQSSPSTSPSPSPTQNHVQPVVDVPSVDQWACGRCTFLNALSDDVCTICNLHKSGVEIPPEAEQRQNNTNNNNNNTDKRHHNTNNNSNRGNNRGRGNRGNYQGSGVGRGISFWSCSACTYDNPSNSQKCAMCDSKRS